MDTKETLHNQHLELDDTRDMKNRNDPKQYLADLKHYLDNADDLYKKGTYPELSKIAQKLADLMDKLKDQDIEVNKAEIYCKIGRAFLKTHHYLEAERFFIKTLETRNEKNVDKDLETAYIMMSLGEAYMAQSKYENAYNNFQTACLVIEKAEGNNTKDMIIYLNYMAEFYMKKKLYQNAKETLVKTSKLVNSLEENIENALVIAQSFFSGAKLHLLCKSYEKSLKSFFEALKRREKVYGQQNHPDISLCYHNIGKVYTRMTEALANFEKALKINLEFFRESHKFVANSYTNVGIAQMCLRNYEQAFDNFKKSLNAMILCSGDQSDELIKLCNSIADILFKADKIDESLEYCMRMIDITIKRFGEDCSNLRDLYTNVGTRYYRKYEYRKAKDWFIKALNISLKCSDFNPLDVALSRLNLGTACLGKREYPETVLQYVEAVKAYNLFFNKTNPDMSRCFLGLGLTFEANKNFNESYACGLKRILLHTVRLGRNHAETQPPKNNLFDLDQRKFFQNPNLGMDI